MTENFQIVSMPHCKSHGPVQLQIKYIKVPLSNINLICYFQNSGIKININCTEEFEKMKMQKGYRYIIFKIRDDMREIQVEECAPRGL